MFAHQVNQSSFAAVRPIKLVWHLLSVSVSRRLYLLPLRLLEKKGYVVKTVILLNSIYEIRPKRIIGSYRFCGNAPMCVCKYGSYGSLQEYQWPR